MTKRKRKEAAEVVANNWPEMLVALGACWLAFRGHEPQEVAKRAGDAAVKVHTLLERLEQLGDEYVRRVMDCKAPAACGCLYCQDKRAEAATEKPS